MKHIALAALLGFLAWGANAQESDIKLAFPERYVSCYSMQLDADSDETRLSCYDELSEDLIEWLSGDVVPTPTGCQIENWNFRETSGYTHVTGTTTCAAGRLTYRLFKSDGETFLISGTTYIRGYAFEFYTDVPYQREMALRYTIQE